GVPGLWRFASSVACRAAPAPPPPASPPAPAAVVAPPAPKCEKIEEGCVSRAETRARIGNVGWDFAPPEGWTYAQGDDVTTASAKSASLGVAMHDGTGVKNERGLRDEVLRRIAGRLGVTLPRKRELLKRKPAKRAKVSATSSSTRSMVASATERKALSCSLPPRSARARRCLAWVSSPTTTRKTPTRPS